MLGSRGPPARLQALARAWLAGPQAAPGSRGRRAHVRPRPGAEVDLQRLLLDVHRHAAGRRRGEAAAARGALLRRLRVAVRAGGGLPRVWAIHASLKPRAPVIGGASPAPQRTSCVRRRNRVGRRSFRLTWAAPGPAAVHRRALPAGGCDSRMARWHVRAGPLAVPGLQAPGSSFGSRRETNLRSEAHRAQAGGRATCRCRARPGAANWRPWRSVAASDEARRSRGCVAAACGAAATAGSPSRPTACVPRRWVAQRAARARWMSRPRCKQSSTSRRRNQPPAPLPPSARARPRRPASAPSSPRARAAVRPQADPEQRPLPPPRQPSPRAPRSQPPPGHAADPPAALNRRRTTVRDRPRPARARTSPSSREAATARAAPRRARPALPR